MTSISELNCPVCNSGKLDYDSEESLSATELDHVRTLKCIDCSHTFPEAYGVLSSKAYFDHKEAKHEG